MTSLKRTFTAFVLAMSLAGSAYAQQATTPAGANAGHAGGKSHPCTAYAQRGKQVCAADRCSEACKSAHEAFKSCRQQHGLPVKQGAGHGGGACKGHGGKNGTGTQATPPAAGR
jgi:hypothetical protein